MSSAVASGTTSRLLNLDGPGSQVRFPPGKGQHVVAGNNIFIVSESSSLVRKVDLSSGMVSIMADNQVATSNKKRDLSPSPAPPLLMGDVIGIAVDKDGVLYVSDMSMHVVWSVTPSSSSSGGHHRRVFTGTYGVSGNVDGVGSDARHSSPASLVGDLSKNALYVFDEATAIIRKIDIQTARVRHVLVANNNNLLVAPAILDASLPHYMMALSPIMNSSSSTTKDETHLVIADSINDRVIRVVILIDSASSSSSSAIHANASLIVDLAPLNVANGLAVHPYTGAIFVSADKAIYAISPSISSTVFRIGGGGSVRNADRLQANLDSLNLAFDSSPAALTCDTLGQIIIVDEYVRVLYTSAPSMNATNSALSMSSTEGNGTHVRLLLQPRDIYSENFEIEYSFDNVHFEMYGSGPSRTVDVGPLDPLVTNWTFRARPYNAYGQGQYAALQVKAYLPEVVAVVPPPTSGGYLTILGNNFLFDANAIRVNISNTPSSSWSHNCSLAYIGSGYTNGSIACIVPEGTGRYGVMQVTVGGVSNLLTNRPTFSYDLPYVSDVSSPSRDGGPLTVLGKNFGADSSKISVYVNDARYSQVNCTDVIILTPHQGIVCTMPPPSDVGLDNQLRLVVDGQVNMDGNALFKYAPVKNVDSGAIAGIVVAVVVAVVVIVAGALLFRYKRRHEVEKNIMLEMHLKEREEAKKNVYIQNVVKGEVLGAGAFGTVYKGEWQGVSVAMKTVTVKDDDALNALLQEAEVMQKLVHPNIVQFLGLYHDAEDGRLYVVSDYVRDGSLDRVLQKDTTITPIMQLKMARDIAAGMIQLEEKGIVHCDLACRNLLVVFQRNSYTVKVTDFGLSRVVQQQQSPSTSGGSSSSSLGGGGGGSGGGGTMKLPIKWSAPEAITSRRFTSKSDVWSYGVTVWELFNRGRVPYEGMNNQQTYDWIAKGNRLKMPPNTPPMIAQMVQQCWLVDPDQRPTFREIITIIDIASSEGKEDSPIIPPPSSSSSLSSRDAPTDASIIESSERYDSVPTQRQEQQNAYDSNVGNSMSLHVYGGGEGEPRYQNMQI
eukprot:TRINITY_DN8598_c0_g1_i4.p1 TRINITY_DN8598_c0_g1~~TRINITY_DN8598_c0_g1_i4.p1  ORF type:complete len:1073 (+),score=198.90 TRINITY_DN8598_c0_g1_i4:49-3219(+)